MYSLRLTAIHENEGKAMIHTQEKDLEEDMSEYLPSSMYAILLFFSILADH